MASDKKPISEFRIRDGKLGVDCAESRKIFTPRRQRSVSPPGAGSLQPGMEHREVLISEAMGLSANEAEIAKDES